MRNGDSQDADLQGEFSRCVGEFRQSVQDLRDAERTMTQCIREMEKARTPRVRLMAARAILGEAQLAVQALTPVTEADAGSCPTPALTGHPLPHGPSATTQLADVAT